MILQALHRYYCRKCKDADPSQRLPAYGLEQKEIPFILEITADGGLMQLRDTRALQGKTLVAQSFRVPQGVKRANNIAANLLWDTFEYVLGVDSKGKPERVAEQHAAFVQRIASLPPIAKADEGIRAVHLFFENLDLAKLQSLPIWAELLACNPVLSFRLQGDLDLICQRPAILQAALNMPSRNDERPLMCLVTGEMAPVERLHTAIKGVWGAQTAGANIVSFNARAFESYGKKEGQGENAPVSKAAAFAYTTALNHLLRKASHQRIQIGDASTVFWADQDSAFESIGADIFGEAPKDDPDRGKRAVSALLSAVQSGKLDTEPRENRFHVLGLAPNAARISIRFYYCLPLSDLAQRVSQHFKDMETVRGLYDPQYPSLFRLLTAVAVQNKADNIPPKLGGAVVDAIFAGPDVPYPALWLNAAVGRCRAGQNVSYLHACAIKACLNRQIRRNATSAHVLTAPEKEYSPMLDLENAHPAYRMGRLFATLERIQEAASGGPGQLNTTIRDRYFGAASSTPIAVFTTLLRLKNAHLKKLTVGQSVNYERLLGEILSTVSDFPAHLTLPDQGRFALGYYHQRQDFFTKRTPSPPTKEGTPA